MMGRNNCQQPVRPCPQPRMGSSCPMPAAPVSGPGPVRPDSACSCSGLSKDQLLRRIATTGFACVDACLYLDTHPDDMGALNYYNKLTECRKNALYEYEKKFEPLRADLPPVSGCDWKWASTPWPWEGGNC